MNDGILRPRNPAAVQLPDNNMGTAPGMGARPGMGGMMNPSMGGMTPQMSGADMVRNMLQSGLNTTNTQSGGGFNWGQYGTTLYEDEALRALKVTPENDPQSMAYYIERVAAAMQQFIYQIYHRAGPLHEEYKKSRESFRMNEAGQVDEVCNAFIDDVNKQADFTRIVAINGAPFFGKGLIELLRQGNRDQLTQQEYLNCTFIATRNILFFELINWLMKAPTGKQYCLRLPQRLQMRIANLENFKEATSAVFEVFNQTSPYANLEFKRPQSTRPDFAMLYGPASEYVHQPFEQNNQTNLPPATDSFHDIMDMVNRNAAQKNKPAYQQPRKEFSMGGEPMSNWDEVRKDFNNLTPLNRKEFQLNRFFRNIGKQDHYVIPESDWTKIKHAYTKHSEMGLEETVMPGCFRIVIMDLEVDNGWFSTIVRAEGLNMQTVLTDPKKLLPLLEDPSLEDTWVVKPVELEEVNGGAGLDIEIETVRKLEQALPVIVVKDPVVSQASADLESTINSVNQRLTSQFTKESAVGFCAVPWDVYVCATPEEKRRLHNDLPFLFKDNTETVSFMNACAAITRYNDQGLISSELINFIDARYTTLVNDWLVNCAGYEGRKNAKRHLSVTSAFNDFRALLEFLKERDPETGAYLVESEKVNYLNEQVKIFDFENPYRKGQAEESEIDKLKHELELVVARPMYINVMNKRGGPSHLENDVPIVIKRSKFPEYFKMIEDGFDVTMGDNYMSESTDKLLKFDESGNMWLFSYSIVDRNVATLRFVTRSKHLCLLALS